MNNGKSVWLSQEVINHLDKALGERDGGGVFDRESYNAILMELLELDYYEDSDTQYNVTLLAVGESRHILRNAKFQKTKMERSIRICHERTGRTFSVWKYRDSYIVTRTS